MSEKLSFNDRVFLGGQAVYERIVRGEVTDVEAELMQVHLTESDREED